MKRSDILKPQYIAWLTPLLLIIPNIVLDITEGYSLGVKICNVFLPSGCYYLLIASSKNVGRTVLFMLPLMILAAFQIVLFYLYGESIIAIDMFINVATTNANEVEELLGNLMTAIITVICIYLPITIWAIYLVAKHIKCNNADNSLKILRCVGVLFSIVGVTSLIFSMASDDKFSLRRDIFPVNVCANLVDAIGRTANSANYHHTSANYNYNATATHPAHRAEIFMLVIGETSRADNWQLYGYERPTTPRLMQRKNLIRFLHTLSESNTTHKSVPMLMSPLTAETFNDSINYVKGIFEAFNEAGFKTVFISNQRRNHSYIDYFGQQADTTIFIRDYTTNSHDGMLVDELRKILANAGNDDKLFIVLHSYGSHFNYKERYDELFKKFTPDDATDASKKNRASLVNAYDNSIVNTDAFIDNIISEIDSTNVAAALIYVSDHGEDIFDDYRNRFLHASPTTTFYQIHVPLILWTSDRYAELYPENFDAARNNSELQVSSSRSVFPTLMHLAGINSPVVDTTAILTSRAFQESERLYLNDYNQAVSLEDAGFKKLDFEKAKSLGFK